MKLPVKLVLHNLYIIRILSSYSYSYKMFDYEIYLFHFLWTLFFQYRPPLRPPNCISERKLKWNDCIYVHLSFSCILFYYLLYSINAIRLHGIFVRIYIYMLCMRSPFPIIAHFILEPCMLTFWIIFYQKDRWELTAIFTFKL